MADTVYPAYRTSRYTESPSVNLISGTVRLAIVSSSASYNAAHQYWSSLNAFVIGTPQALANKTTTGDRFSSDPVNFTGITASNGRLVLYLDTGTAGTSPLLAWYDSTLITVTAAPVAVTPNSTIGWFRF